MNNGLFDGIVSFVSHSNCHENGRRQADDSDGVDEFGKENGMEPGFQFKPSPDCFNCFKE